MKKKLLVFLCFLLLAGTIFSFCREFQMPAFLNRTKNTVIVIDVGHGGNDPGKVSLDGTREKDINLQIASYLKDYLIAQDFTVYLTRENDCGLYDENVSNKKTSDLNNRIQFFKDKEASYVVSIHQNSYPDASQHGAQTFYYSNSTEGKSFAESIQNAVLKVDETNTRLAKSNDSYYLLKNSSIPVVIVECGFLSNPEETAKLKDEYYQKELAYAISLGICQYIK